METAIELARRAKRRGALQDELELVEVVRYLQRLRHPAGEERPLYNVLEIGVNAGGTFWLWRQLARGRVGGIDIAPPPCLLCDGRQAHGEPCARIWLERNIGDGYLYIGDSMSVDAIEWARVMFRHGVDLLHIDGDHSPDAVRSDFETYRELVLPGGVILVHDIAGDNPEWGVVDYWRDVLRHKPGAFAIRNTAGNWAGMGVVPV